VESEIIQKRWMALNCASYLSPPYAARNSVEFSLIWDESNVLTDRKPELKESQTKGTETENASDAKVEVTAGL